MVSEEEKEDVHDAGAYIVSTLNKMEEEERKKWFKAVLGAFIGLVKLDKEVKMLALEEVKKKLNLTPNCDYIG